MPSNGPRLRVLVTMIFLGAALSAYAPPFALSDVGLGGYDFQGNVTTSDRTVYYANGGTGGVHGSVEIPLTGGPGAPGVAYVRGASASVTVTAVNNRSDDAVVGELEIQAARLVAPDHSDGTPGEVYAISVGGGGTISLNLPKNGGTRSLTISLSGIPNHVALGSFELKYRMPVRLASAPANATYAQNGTNGGFRGITRMYVLDATPTGAQAVPWTDFLEFACRWGFGAAGADLAQKTTYGMHYSNRHPANKFVYNATLQTFTMDQVAVTYLNLHKFLNAVTNNAVTEGDCNDYAAILALALQAHGLSCDVESQRAQVNGASVQFITTELCRAGLDSTNYEGLGYAGDCYEQQAFYVHTISKINGKYCDASNSYAWSPAGAALRNPVADMVMPSYWQNPISQYGYGLCYGSAYYPASTNFLARSSTQRVVGIPSSY